MTKKRRAAWSIGVLSAAADLLAELKDADGHEPEPGTPVELWERLLSPHAVSCRCSDRAWEFAKLYSWGGGALIWHDMIAARYCTPSEVKRLTRRDGSLRNPNSREEWADLQARALYQAMRVVAHHLETGRPLADCS